VATRKIFVIHGHDHDVRNAIVRFIRNEGLSPVLMQEEEPLGDTFIEKFLRCASECVFAIALLTPDDKQAEDLNNTQRWRARQNVIFEMGWFVGKLSRKHVIMIHRGHVELPSDLTGVEYLEIRESIFDITARIRKTLVALGIV
jgi:predicted nucleotide-binding protein